MAIKDTITVISKPSVPLKELSLPDDSQTSQENLLFKTSKAGLDAKDSAGAIQPLVFINSVQISDIEYLCVDETGKIPTIKLIFNDNVGSLNGSNYPKNDPIVSVYIKTQNSKFKPIRCDFLINEMKPIGSNNRSFSIYGELYIPKLYDNVSKSYRNKSSNDAMLELAKDLSLGYARNEFSTSDVMTWVNSNDDSLEFMTRISSHAYKDDDSFFTSFIDKYYNINLIDVSEQLNASAEINYTFQNSLNAMSKNITKEISEMSNGSDSEEITLPIYLSNNPVDMGRPQYIREYNLSGEVGYILQNRGYRHEIYYYDHQLDSDKFTKFYVNPVKIKGYPNNDQSLMPDDETLRSNLIKKWQCIDYGNAHSEWNASKVINDHNNIELNKIKMHVETGGINFQVIRGSGIYVAIYQDSAEVKFQQANREKTNNIADNSKSDNSTVILDDTLTGRYYVNGVKYIFDKTLEPYQFKTKFELCKMNWRSEKNISE